MPYFLSNPFSDAIAIGAQSVSGINPTRTVDCSGLSDPAAHAAASRRATTSPRPARRLPVKNAAVKSKIYRPYPLQNTQKKRPTVLMHCWTPLSMDTQTAVGLLPKIVY
jgi:hypothetical protein